MKEDKTAYYDALVAFFFLLLQRDHISVGKMDALMQEALYLGDNNNVVEGPLARYANDLVETLKNHSFVSLTKKLEQTFTTGPSVFVDSEKFVKPAEPRDITPTIICEQEPLVEYTSSCTATCSDVVEQPSVSTTSGESNIASSFFALDQLALLVPTDEVKQITEILKGQVESALNDTAKAKLRETLGSRGKISELGKVE